MLKIQSLVLGLVAATLLPAAAQSKSGPKVRFLAERAPQEIGKVLLAVKEVKTAPFDLPVNHLSEPQSPPARAFAVWSTAKNVSLSTVTLPEQGDNFIVLLVPSATGGYSPVVISASDPQFRPGDIYFYNHADKTVLGYVGTAKFILEPGKGRTLRPEGPSGDGNFYNIGLGVREEAGDRPLSTSRWPVQKQMRMYVFFYTNPQTGRLDFRAVDEFIEPEAPKP